MSILEPSTKGKLLLATPPLEDPNFDRTVILVLEHNEGGAVGVVLNRPTMEVDLDGLDDWVEIVSPPVVVFSGGPVAHEALIAVGRADVRTEEAWSVISGDIGTVDLSVSPTDAAPLVTGLRIFRGYSGWGPHQLDGELAAGAWMVFSAETDDPFTTDPTALWRSVLRRQGGRTAWIADAPDDLSAN
ncbi:MAG: YqgE/AlgH family protein [Ilumatobacteraceae bacterium]